MSTKVYLQDEQIKLIQTVASASTFISSLCGEIKEYILGKFPPGYFRHIHVDTGTASNIINTNRNYNKKLNKIPYPNLAIETLLSIDSPINGTEQDVNHSAPNMFLRRDLNSYYQKILFDPEDKFAMYYTTQFVTCNFTFKINVNSFIQMTNLVYFLKEELHLGIFQYLNSRPISTEIPKTFIKIISNLLGYDMNDPDNLDELSVYLMSVSRKNDAIRRKLNNNTGKVCFMLNDLTDLIITVDDLDAPGGISREGQAEGEYTIGFRVQVTAPVANQFILSIDKKKFKKIADDVDLSNEIFAPDTETADNFTTVSVLDINGPTNKETIYFKDSQDNTHIGVKLFSENINMDINTSEVHINLKEFIRDNILDTHSYMRTKGYDPTSLFYFRVFDVTGERKDLEMIDYDVLDLYLTNLRSDLVIVGYADRTVYESVEKARELDIDIFNDNFLTTLRVNSEDSEGNMETRYAVVKRFINEEEEYSTDLEKAVRISTLYGVGYLYLVPEEDPKASDLKICVGEDKFGNKIIKSIVLLEE